MEKDATATLTLRAPVRFWRNTLTAAKLYPGLKGLAWASWSPVIQRCSQPYGFSLLISFFLKCVSETSKQPPRQKNTACPPLQTRSTCPRFRLLAINPTREMELHLLFLKMTPPTTKPVMTDSKCLHVYFS
ncbi:KSR1 isoform 19 [Pan troglodytes]|uniref:KSR1 isoform 19 n=2 Tax=Pan troglodytes TaxID=9598 RepID=A0A6D2W8X9_PANTR|nr:KSR1 isoform 19 [Pan troglodytes]